MTKKSKKSSIAHAQAFRHKLKPTEIVPEWQAAENSIHRFSDLATHPVDVDWEYDCGYEGGINRDNSETEYQPAISSDEPETDAESSDDELEWNPLQQHKLLAEVATLTKPTPYSNSNSTHNWAKAEKNQSLGYNGQSEHSK